jgi:hypothetical protein
MIRHNLSETRPITIDGQEAVFVPLTGKHGRGLEMLLDASVWALIEKPWGHACRATLMQSGSLRVDHPDHGALARWILQAPHRARVSYRNEDWMDLRRSNLVLAKDEPQAARPRISPEQAEKNAKRAAEAHTRRIDRLIAEVEKIKARNAERLAGADKKRQPARRVRSASTWQPWTKEQRRAGLQHGRVPGQGQRRPRRRVAAQPAPDDSAR